VTEPAVYLIGGPASAVKTAVARALSGFGAVLEDDGPEALLGDRRTAIRSRPCHVIVLDGADAAARVGIWLETTGRTPDEIVDEILARTTSARSPLVVADYDDRWPAYFEEVAQPVRDALADLDAEVEHVGATSVPGLAAKPIVDIDVVVDSAEDVPAAIERLRSLGYVYQGDKGIEGRAAFMWPPGARRHHLYVVVRGSPPHVAHVEFRDYLRDHPGAARDYGVLKKELAVRYGDDPLAYGEAKTDFVTGVLRAARR